MPVLKKRVTRFDAGELTKAVRTPQGFLRAPAIATRTGVLSYRFPDGSVRRELRHPEDVFAADSLATLAGVPFTDDHPNVRDPSVMLLTPENVSDFMVGYTGDQVTQVDDKFVGCTVTITDAGMIDNVEGGKVEVSCGYTCDHEEVPGTFDGQPYDVRQRNIVYNHLAGVKRGRAGPDVRLRLDAADAVQVSLQPLEVPKMEKITINGVEFEVAPALKAAIEKALADAAQAQADAAKAVPAVAAAQAATVEQTQRADKAEAKADGLTADLAKVKADLAAKTDGADPKVIDARVKSRMRVLKVAERVLPTDELAKLDAATDQAIMVAVIKAEVKGVNLDGKSEAYVEARFDGIAETIDAGDVKRPLGKDLNKERTDGTEPDAEAARKRSMERSADAWKRTDAAK